LSKSSFGTLSLPVFLCYFKESDLHDDFSFVCELLFMGFFEKFLLLLDKGLLVCCLDDPESNGLDALLNIGSVVQEHVEGG